MKKTIWALLFCAIAASVAVAVTFTIFNGTAQDVNGTALGSGWTISVCYHTTFYSVTDGKSIFNIVEHYPDPLLAGSYYLTAYKSGHSSKYAGPFTYLGSGNPVNLGNVRFGSTAPPE